MVSGVIVNKIKYYVYVLKSKIVKRVYIGHTDNTKRRLNEHNSGKTKSTKAYRPYEIMYTKGFETREAAIRHEKELKKGYTRERLYKEAYSQK